MTRRVKSVDRHEHEDARPEPGDALLLAAAQGRALEALAAMVVDASERPPERPRKDLQAVVQRRADTRSRNSSPRSPR